MGMALDEPRDEDQKVSIKGVDFIYDKADENFMPDSVIDFQDSFLGKGFVVRSAVGGVC